MKKILLSAVALLASVQLSNAQDVSTYAVDFASGSNLTCLSGAAIQSGINPSGAAFGNPARIPSYSYNFADNAALQFTVTASTPAGAGDPLWFDLFYKKGPAGPSQTCNPFTTDDDNLNMSTNTKVCVIAKSSVAGSAFVVHLWANGVGQPWIDGATTYSVAGGPGNTILKEVSGLTTSYAAYELDFGTEPLFTGWANKNEIQGWGVNSSTVFDGATISIQRITFGNTGTCALTLSNSSANVVNDEVNLFPNPAKGSFSVDITAMNVESALVKVMNSNGIVVKEFNASNTTSVSTEGLVKGIYMVQVTSGNKVANKKVVVE